MFICYMKMQKKFKPSKMLSEGFHESRSPHHYLEISAKDENEGDNDDEVVVADCFLATDSETVSSEAELRRVVASMGMVSQCN